MATTARAISNHAHHGMPSLEPPPVVEVGATRRLVVPPLTEVVDAGAGDVVVSVFVSVLVEVTTCGFSVAVVSGCVDVVLVLAVVVMSGWVVVMNSVSTRPAALDAFF